MHKERKKEDENTHTHKNNLHNTLASFWHSFMFSISCVQMPVKRMCELLPFTSQIHNILLQTARKTMWNVKRKINGVFCIITDSICVCMWLNVCFCWENLSHKISISDGWRQKPRENIKIKNPEYNTHGLFTFALYSVLRAPNILK